MTPPKNPIDTDDFIESFIGLNEKEFTDFSHKCSPGITRADAKDHLLRWIRRRAVRRSEYAEPSVGGAFRRKRTKLKWSWVEEQIMKFAFSGRDSETPEGVEVTEDYIANLLQRTAEEVKEKRYTKLGIRGFDL